jgi:flagellar motor switch protein FliN
MSTDVQSYADDLASVFCSSARQTLRAALGRSCGLALNPERSASQTPLALVFTLTEGGRGRLVLFLTKESAAMLADLMMMGDGTATWNDDHMDALQELGNQLAGAFSTGQTERWATRIVFRASVETTAEFGDAVSYSVDLDVQGFALHLAALTVSQELAAMASELDDARASHSDLPKTDDFTEGISRTDEDVDDVPPPAASSRRAAPLDAPPPATAWIDSKDPSVQRLLDVPIEVTIELGQTELSIRRILEIGPGSIIELDRMAGEPVDLVVNDKVIARGEVVVIEENFGIRITALVSPEERARPAK